MIERPPSVFSKEDLEYLQSLKVLIATPCYGGMTNSNFMLSMTMLYRLIGHEALDFTSVTIANESLITRARNGIVSTFIEKDFTHLFFIDADIGFKHIDVFRLLLKKKDVITGAYPMKTIDWEKTVGSSSWEEAQRRSIHYVINPVKEENNEVRIVDGLIKVLDAGTGFMCISKEAIDQIIDAYGEEIMYLKDSVSVDDTGKVSHIKEPAYAIFDTSIEQGSNRYLSEDYTFCRRWQSIGGDIWLDPSVILDHYGAYAYKGYNYIQSVTPSQS